MNTKEFDIKPIETEYNGILFRSRTEARWVVFFDACDIKYNYEYEGFDLGNLGYYLPDFYLSTFNTGCFAEVKGIEFTDLELNKCEKLCELIGKDVLLLKGIPDLKCIEFYTMFNGKSEIFNGIPNADEAEGEDRLFTCPGYENNNGTISEEYWDILGSTFTDAVKLAKSYRF